MQIINIHGRFLDSRQFSIYKKKKTLQLINIKNNN